METFRLAVCCAALLTSLAAPAQSLHITTESSAPSAFMQDGKLTGYATDKLREALRRAGLQADFELLPWVDAIGRARAQTDTCVYPTTRTPERERQFRWVGPIAHTDWWLYGVANRDYRVATLRDARALRIGAYTGDVRGEFLKSRGFLVDFAADDAVNPKRLVTNRIDLWVTSPMAAQAYLEQVGLTDEVQPILKFNSALLYLACHPKTPARALEKLDAALDAMERDGFSRRIEDAYGIEPRRRPAR